MSTEMDSSSSETRELLQRILKSVEPEKKKRGFEIAVAVVLSLATTASAWCAYQSKLWGGAQAARGGAAANANREVSLNSLLAVQGRVFDASMFINYMEARVSSNRLMEEFLFQRFRPEMKPAVEAWFKLDPLNNPDAPPSPLHMKEYAQKELAEMARHEDLAAAAGKAAREAREYSDNYVLLTVLFASVLFFGGIARAFDSRRLRIVLTALAFVLFVVNLGTLVTLPLCHE